MWLWCGFKCNHRGKSCANINICHKVVPCQFKMHSGLWFLRRRFSTFLCYICLYKIMSPWGRAIYDPRNYICANLNLLVPRMFHTKYQCIPASGSCEDFLVYQIFPSLLLGPKGANYLNCTNLNESPFSKDASYRIWLKSIQWFLRSFCIKEMLTAR